MTRIKLWVVALALLLAGGILSAAEKPDSKEIIQRGKQSTALLTVRMSRGSGTAFCVHEKGLFLTNAYVVKAIPKGETVRLVLQPGEKDEQVLTADVVMSDENLALALLRVKEDVKLTPLKFGDSENLVETQQIYCFSFPFCRVPIEEKKFPSITVNAGHVTALRKSEGVLELIQIDVAPNLGNLGGPVLDENGEVVGVIRAGATGIGATGILLVPAATAKQFLSRVIVTCDAPQLSVDALDKPVKFTANVVDFQPSPDKPLEVELTVEPMGMLKSVRRMTGEDNQFSADVVILPKRAETESLGAKVEYEGGGILEGMLAPVAFKAGEEEITFDRVSDITGGAKPQITLRADGTKKDIAADTKLVLTVGPHKLDVGLAAVKRVLISAPMEPPENVIYTIVVRRGGVEAGRADGTIWISGATSVAGEGPTINPAQFEGDKLVKKCPDIISDIVDAANGKYLVCHFSKLRKLGIFDVEKLDFVNYVPVDDDNVKFAAGRDKLIVAMGDSKVLQRWSLTTFEKELTVTIPFPGKVLDMCMGRDSNGPLYIMSDKQIQESQSTCAIMDITTLRIMDVKLKVGGWPLRASSDGTLVALGGCVMAYDGGQPVYYNRDGSGMPRPPVYHDDSGLLMLNPAGALVFGYGAVYNRELKLIRQNQQETMIPARQGDYCLGISWRSDLDNSNQQKMYVRVCIGQDSRSLVSMGDMGIGQEFLQNQGNTGISLDKRIWCLPLSRVLIILPPPNDQFGIYRFDPEAALEKSEIDYLFVKSTPPGSVWAGDKLFYKIEVKSKRGGVRFKLESGPDGMLLGDSGELVWAVPADIVEARVAVIVSITDSTGQEIYHNFDLKIAKP